MCFLAPARCYSIITVMHGTMKKITACLFVSWLCLAALAIQKMPSPTMTANNWQTDHYSHWGSAVLFLEKGFDIYRHPIRELCLPTSPADMAFAEAHGLNKDDVCTTTLQPRDGRPVLINWNIYPRPYPPGVLLYSAPEALLFLWTNVSFASITLFSVLKYLFFAHLAFGAFIVCFFAKGTSKGATTLTFDPFVGFVVLPMIAATLLLWSFNGVYDPVAILCVVLSVMCQQRKRPQYAILFLAAAIFLHFRALWWGMLFLPYVGSSSRTSLKKPGVFIPLAIGALLLAVGLYSFILDLPALRTFSASNPYYPPNIVAEPTRKLFFFILPASAILVGLAQLRCWTLLTAVAWHLFMLFNSPETRGWHLMFVLPIFAIAMLEKQEKRLHALAICFGLFLLEGVMVFGSPFPMAWEILDTLVNL